jgi:hypothetical protein
MRPRTSIVHALAFLSVAASFVMMCGVTEASPVTGIGGLDYSTGPDDAASRSALVGVAGSFGGAQFSPYALRFDDDVAGDGTGFGASVATPALAVARLRVSATRFTAAESFTSWRTKAGPEFALPHAGSLGVYWSRSFGPGQDDVDSGSLEFAMPMVASLSARAQAGYASAGGGRSATLGAVGLGWSPARFVQITGDVGLASSGAVSATTIPAPRPLLPLLGGGGSPTTTNRNETSTGATFQIGLRVTTP